MKECKKNEEEELEVDSEGKNGVLEKSSEGLQETGEDELKVENSKERTKAEEKRSEGG